MTPETRSTVRSVGTRAAPPDPSRSPYDEMDPLEPVRRRAYIFACVVGIVVDGLLAWLHVSSQPATSLAYGVVTGALVVLFLVLISPTPLAVAERGACGLLTLAFLARLGIVLYGLPDLNAQASELIVSLLILTIPYLLAFMVLDKVQAVALSLGVLATAGLMVLAWINGTAGASALPDGGTALLKAFTIKAVLIALLYVLAATKDQMVQTRAREQEMTAAARTDPLTGTSNRRELSRLLDHHLARAKVEGDPLAVMILDLDHFKAVNDGYGHEAGDRLLRHLCGQIASELESTESLGRWGGDEFLILAPGSDASHARELAERCRHRLREEPVPGLGVSTASFGIATMQVDDDLDELLRRADHALYRAKRGGRDRVVVDGLTPARPSGRPRGHQVVSEPRV